ncbi:hypothetical protein GKZ28_23125 [Clostridium chromiireducens]|uniref:Uncharacterized protein n=1 Tax=Clostridium chromiireducens TaxID=225345 RepID=A0A964W4R1_9CLOT|nr:DUF6063 family protein [Clostridium chromiireducens]MVX66565.1 hypothetical protein [Clostridium chromiireducens]
MYTLEDIRKAMRLYNYLLSHGELTAQEEKETFLYYSDVKVREIISTFEEESQVSIKKYDDTIYFIPNVDNDFLGYKRSELRKEIFPRGEMKNIDLFLCMYIMIQLTSEFYSGRGNNVKIRDLIQLGELDGKITERLELFLDKEDRAVDEESGLAITDISKYWFTLINEDDAASFKTRRWYISQVMNFLKKENLISIQDETVIIPTSKFNRLAANYFLNYERLEDINRILNEKTMEEEPHA